MTIFPLETAAGHVKVVEGGCDGGGEHAGRDQPGDERRSWMQRHLEVDHASHDGTNLE